jgi:hypothetical protein
MKVTYVLLVLVCKYKFYCNQYSNFGGKIFAYMDAEPSHYTFIYAFCVKST